MRAARILLINISLVAVVLISCLLTCACTDVPIEHSPVSNFIEYNRRGNNLPPKYAVVFTPKFVVKSPLDNTIYFTDTTDCGIRYIDENGLVQTVGGKNNYVDCPYRSLPTVMQQIPISDFYPNVAISVALSRSDKSLVYFVDNRYGLFQIDKEKKSVAMLTADARAVGENNGTLFFVSQSTNMLKSYDIKQQNFTTIAHLGNFNTEYIYVTKENEIIFGDRYYIKKLLTNGTITTIAGTGRYNSTVNGNDALQTDLDEPKYFGVHNGDIYFCVVRFGNYFLRKISHATNIVELVIDLRPYTCKPFDIDSNGDILLGTNAQDDGVKIKKINSTSISTLVEFAPDNYDQTIYPVGTNAADVYFPSPKNYVVRSPDLVIFDETRGIVTIDLNSQKVVSTFKPANGKILTGTCLGDDLYYQTSTEGTIYKYSKGVEEPFMGGSVYERNTSDPFSTDLVPYYMHLDEKNNHLYICDVANHVVRKLDLNSNMMSIVAGNGGAGFSGDGGLATDANLNGPHAVFVNEAGEVIISDSANNRIRIVSTNGIINTIAGNGGSAISPEGTLASQASINDPKSLFILENEIYVSETGNSRILKFKINETIEVVVGTGIPSFNGNGLRANETTIKAPHGILVYPNKTVIFADNQNHIIRKVENGIVTTIAGIPEASGVNLEGGNPLEVTLYYPSGLAFGKDDNEIYLVDHYNTRLRKLSYSWIETIVGGLTDFRGFENVKGRDIKLGTPIGLVRNSKTGDLYVSDLTYNTVRRISGDDLNVNTVVCSFLGDRHRRNQKLSTQLKMASASGALYILDYYYSSFRKVQIDNGYTQYILGGVKETLIGRYVNETYIQYPTDFLVTKTGDIWILFNTQIIKIDNAGVVTNLANLGNFYRFGVSEDGELFTSNDDYIYRFVNGGTEFFYSSPIGYINLQVVSNNTAYFTESDTWRTADFMKMQKQYCPTGYDFNHKRTVCTPLCFGKKESLACSMRAECVDPDQCSCNSTMWTGYECEYPVCYGLSQKEACSSNGKCSSPNNCTCNKGYEGIQCETTLCFGLSGRDSCSLHGNCSKADTCECDSGWTGLTCEIPICYSILANNTNQACSSNGKCSSPNNCTCNKGYEGIQCETALCFGLSGRDSCSLHGNCSKADTCECDSGWTGSTCEIPICYSILASNTNQVCSGHGDCLSPNNCTCFTGYNGNNCQIHSCFGLFLGNKLICSGNGKCLSLNTCQCNSQFSGNQCGTPVAKSERLGLSNSQCFNLALLIVVILQFLLVQ